MSTKEWIILLFGAIFLFTVKFVLKQKKLAKIRLQEGAKRFLIERQEEAKRLEIERQEEAKRLEIERQEEARRIFENSPEGRQIMLERELMKLRREEREEMLNHVKKVKEEELFFQKKEFEERVNQAKKLNEEL